MGESNMGRVPKGQKKERKKKMSRVPQRCGFCKYCTPMRLDGCLIHQCAHKGGWDNEGMPGWVYPTSPPPVWCPAREGTLFTKIFVNMFGKKKTATTESPTKKETPPIFEGIKVTENPEMAALRAELKREREAREAAEEALKKKKEEQDFATEDQGEEEILFDTPEMTEEDEKLSVPIDVNIQQ